MGQYLRNDIGGIFKLDLSIIFQDFLIIKCIFSFKNHIFFN